MSYGVFAQHYDRLTENVDYAAMAERVLALLAQYRPSCPLVLDLACGTGTLTALLAQAGCDMIGTDASPDMLSVAAQKDAPGAVFLCQPMQKLDLYGTIGAAVCALDSVNHITSPEVLRTVFERVALFLEDDGVFLFDANTPYKHEHILADNTFVYDLDDLFCVWQNETADGMTSITLDFFARRAGGGGLWSRRSESFRERAYSDAELCEMLDAAGLVVDGRFDGYTDQPVTDTTERVLYVCKRKPRA